ncbi:arylsulfatase [Methylovirgula ligni]|uniref:Arylsulfatase n=1 Tax=Methylovirgula ligni TaxID=569860 RepID=A0A3D9YUK9_9HYPH|nr:arylsulfatase [Methylovirgula ligni]QAY96031.1 arylsulfatase [Methylovirgula ligni]REF86297.1 arylsulfatase [Methylovirgula ligni]
MNSNDDNFDKKHEHKRGMSRRRILLSGTVLAATSAIAPQFVRAEDEKSTSPASGKKSNILVIFGDDIGQSDISAYTFGLMGYRTPNIDRIAKEGLMFTDYYAEQSCTAGRSSFITGQSVIRTGLSKVGIPGATVGLQPEDITIAEALKPLGYATGQYGKNHLGDRNEFLPTVHGFDEFFGNLYHLNAEEDPEDPDYPKDPAFRAKFGPRGVLRCKASETDDPTVDSRFGRVGKQTIEDTGPLTKKRMETIDDETTSAAIDFIQRQVKAGKPFFCWMNTTRMHLYTHVRASMRGQSGMPDNEYADGMIEHDGDVGKLLKVLDDLGITDDTIVLYTTDNGPHMNSWPDGAMTPFRSEKNTNWEGAYRVPAMVRWPGHIKPGSIANDIFGSHDWFPTLLALAGDTSVKDRLLSGWTIGDRTYKVHLDGYNQLAYLTGQQPNSERKAFIYFNDDGQLVAIRFNNWKLVFFEQKTPGTLDVWGEPFTARRFPLFFNLRMDPYERAEITSNSYYAWTIHKAYLLYGGQAIAGAFAQSLQDYPPRQKPQSFNLDQIMDNLKQPTDD